MAGNSNEPNRTVTSKAAAILLALTAGRGHTTSTLARETTLPISTVHRLVRDLASSPLVERIENGEYRFAPVFRNLRPMVESPTLATHGPLSVDDLVDALKMTVRLGVVEALQIAYITKGVGPKPGTLFPNRDRLPVHATAMGKVLLAFGGSTALLQAVVAVGLTRFTPHTITDVETLRQEVLRTRLRGHATSDRELEQKIRAVGVPVLSASGEAIAAIEVHVPDLDKRTIGQVAPALSVAGQALGRQLGSDKAVGVQAQYRRMRG